MLLWRAGGGPVGVFEGADPTVYARSPSSCAKDMFSKKNKNGLSSETDLGAMTDVS